jgi:kumamolisin
MTEPRRALPGSARAAAPGVTVTGPLPPDEQVATTVVLRRREPVPAELVEGPETLTPEQLAAAHGADPADAERVREVLTAAGLRVDAVDLASRRVQVSGPAAAAAAAFGTELTRATSPDPRTGAPVEHRYRTGELTLPAQLDGIVEAVLGLDDRPQARTQVRLAIPNAAQVSYTPPQLGRAYAFPAGTDGAGQTLAIVELGGGFAQADLDSYFGGLGIGVPTVRAVGVDGATNVAGQDPQGADGEVLLDIEIAGALAPRATVVVYFGPNSDRGFVDAVATAVHATPTPTALSISWGLNEDAWTAQARNALDGAFVDAAALGVTVCVAAGDSGSSDGAADGRVHVDFPAASPHALACGGTRLTLDGTGAAGTETVWDGGATGGSTGGGISDVFTLPAWQTGAGVPQRSGGGTGRGVPDVAGDADPATGYQVLVDGTRMVIGGTSAVAPLWAALVCRLGQALGKRLGLLQPALYAAAKPGVAPPGFRDITTGSNGAYRAGKGWDACTGLGVPDGERLLTALRG